MEYILALDFNQDPPYFVRVREDGWDECYSPVVATVFPSKREAVKWGKENTSLGEYMRARDRAKAIEVFEKWVAGGMVRRQFEQLSPLSRKYDPKKDTKEDVLRWRYETALRGDDHSIRYEDSKTWPGLYSLYECLWSISAGWSDSNNTTVTATLRIPTKTKFETFRDELNLIVDKVTYREHPEDDYVLMSIIDHYCSEGGNSVYLAKYDSGQWGVKGRFQSMIVEPTSLEACFKYLQAVRYYEE